MLPIIDIHLLRDIQEVNAAFISVLQRIVRENAHALLREPLSPDTEARLMAMDDLAIHRMARSSMLACSFHCTGPEVLKTLGIPEIDVKLIPIALPPAKVVE
ncbi:flagellar transcriptional regulator FlhD [Alcaligenaceae bacterium C4P045]|nr:flagellar transcriptional regulator FlhD [Alcaligenaceae bacterium B3P038]MDQ2151369.1 flagellar transcriptional regulator FlhD [Alcaligenaceae bacterium C4P045]